MRNKKIMGFFLLALLGAGIATVCDGFHVYTRALSYTHPCLFGQAWWVFPGFVVIFLFIEYTYFLLAGHLPAGIDARQSVSAGSLRGVVETTTTFALVYLLSGFGNFEPVWLSVIFYSTFLARWLFTYDRMWLLVLSILMAFGGMFVEGLYAAAGLMTYRQVDVFHVPFWLGGLYVHGAFALREGMRYFVYGSEKNVLH
jgi:hypothetical protein